ncbi:hydrogen peroxide-dependent heme synthase [Corynebacterium uberis]|uniref:hydrogen peroxide-dependent heme synthase n=1 Tax=Corynebacterium TaxID=1716 RepID=UPI001D0B34EF|nr:MULTISPECIES: hydrogen peroxide-dependent heme synthase [Corynebacterium]MCZ9308527.1 chlorite dismutase family protein [Corynebacterium sp. c6VSa_13]UDL74179.1 chlorite dismutase family protein [Corynebacterium uberis]UDL74937.1 chlorite dismutase family protein [Corynebacterium uberis]UDL77152.1 chlorite dismutase family protein [Corynebacterium uberis]UDL79434.1 chlorite dismutase family protein [Corynebacterium uberis]
MADMDLDQLNNYQQYTQYAVFHIGQGALPDDRTDVAAQFQKFLDDLAAAGTVTVRGVYLASGFKADSDLIIWWHAPEFSDLQSALNDFRRTTVLGQVCELVWCGNGVHRPSEFNKAHLPSFIMGEEPEEWMTVYPFVRSYDWYVLDPTDRRRILAEHGRAAAGYKDVRANTTTAFALGDYEWMLAFEASDMGRIVDLMHDMRYTEARLHVREEIPFYSGRRIMDAQTLLNALP